MRIWDILRSCPLLPPDSQALVPPYISGGGAMTVRQVIAQTWATHPGSINAGSALLPQGAGRLQQGGSAAVAGRQPGQRTAAADQSRAAAVKKEPAAAGPSSPPSAPPVVQPRATAAPGVGLESGQQQSASKRARATVEPATTEKIIIVFRDQSGGEVHFKVKRSTKMANVFKAYCDKTAVELHSMKFLFGGTRVDLFETPAQMKIEDGDVVDAIIEQTGD